MGIASTERLLSEIDDQGKEWLRRALGLGEDHDPFPWQIELLRRFLRGDDIQALDIPTGLGKTATIAVWLVARALGAKLPRRLVYVVDRRAVVDQATEEAERIRKVVDETPEFEAALGLARSLPISTLRGQYVDNREWLEDPSIDTIEMLARDDTLSKLAIETELFVGGRRVAEREAAAKRLPELGLLAGTKRQAEKSVFVVATSAGEVGVDLDADHAVLDLVEWERMVQRLGRVNRRGEGEADVYVVPTAIDDKSKDALAKEEKILALRHNSDNVADDEDDEDGDGAGDKRPKRLKEDERNRVDRWKRRVVTLRRGRFVHAQPRGEDGGECGE